jgi:membrane protease YdiL (CAAX protease family)
MATIKVFIKSHSLPIYFVLTFIISWGSLTVLSGGPGGFPSTKEEFERLLPLFIPAVLAGPSLAGILLTGLVSGRAGFRELLSRLLRWRVGVRWYAVALLTAPLVLTAELLALSLSSQRFLPGLFSTDDKASRLVMGLVAGLVVGICEELGWTGFATPRLRLRYRIFATGLIVGVLWGAWHIFLNVVWVSGAYSGELSPVFFLTARAFGDLVGLLPAYRVLTVWVYDRTGSLLVAMLMHASLTASTMVFEPLGISGMHLLIYDLVSAAAMWVVAAAVVVADHRQLSHQPLRFKQIRQKGDASL